MNFGEWGEPKMSEGDASMNQQQHQRAGSTAGSERNQESSDAGLIHPFEHAGVFCDNCNSTVTGFRYKCLQCPDYDLCANCERRGCHAGHVMMRIAFPEQATEAIKRYFSREVSVKDDDEESPTGEEEGSPPDHHGHHGQGKSHIRHHHGKFRGHKRHGRHQSDSSDDDAGPSPGIPRVGCPYVMGKKEMKKWSKNLKKMAYHHRRTAETQGQGEAGNDGQKCKKRREAREPADYSQVISQIQAYFNNFGIPIDVVTLYDDWGNGLASTTGNRQPQTATAGTSTAEGTTKQSAGAGAAAPAGTAEISSQLQNMRIDTPNQTGDANPTASGAGNKAVDEFETDWTMLDPERAQLDSVTIVKTVASPPTSFEPVEANSTPVSAVQSVTTETLTAPRPQVSASTAPVNTVQAPASVAAPVPPMFVNPPLTSRPSAPPLYPPLPNMPNLPYNLMNVVNGVSSTVGNAIRTAQSAIPNMPVIPNFPNVPNAESVKPTAADPNARVDRTPDLTPAMSMTLNQLLSMGFSNHDGWLARLVLSKNGDMEATLNALFPVSGGQ